MFRLAGSVLEETNRIMFVQTDGEVLAEKGSGSVGFLQRLIVVPAFIVAKVNVGNNFT